MARRSSRNAWLGKVHIGLKQLKATGMTDDDYRAMLDDRYGHRSAGDLSIPKLKDLVKHMESLGARFIKKPKPDDPQARKIRSLWLQMHKAGKVRNSSEQALNAFVKGQIGIDRLDWIAPAQARDLIERMKKWLKR